MKGLLIKDMQLLKANKQILLLFLLIGLMFLVTGTGGSVQFGLGYLVSMGGMVAVFTISYDEFEDGLSFLLTMPVTRRLYALEKCVLVLLMIAGSILAAIVLTFGINIIKGGSVYLGQLLGGSPVVVISLSIMILIMMVPLQLKFGTNHTRIIVFAGVAVFALIGFITDELAQKFDLNRWIDLSGMADRVIQMLSEANAFAIGAVLILLSAVTVSFSMWWSIRIMEKKQF